MNLKVFLLTLISGLVWAESIDNEIIQDLDFFTNMDVIEEMDSVEGVEGMTPEDFLEENADGKSKEES